MPAKPSTEEGENLGEYTLTDNGIISEGDTIRGHSGDALIEGEVKNIQLTEHGEQVLRVSLVDGPIITDGVIEEINGKRVVRPLSLGLADSWHMKACPFCGASAGALMNADKHDFGIRECDECSAMFDITNRNTEAYLLDNE